MRRSSWLLFVFTILMSCFAKADPTVFTGKYVFQNRITLLTALEVRQVNLDQSGGWDLLEELKDKGFVCQQEDQHWFGCRKMHDDWEIPKEVTSLFNKQYENALAIEFLKPAHAPVLEHADQNYERWRYYQNIKWNNQTFGEFRLILTREVEKITFGGGELVVNKTKDAMSLGFVESKNIYRDNGIDWVTYYVELQLDPVNTKLK